MYIYNDPHQALNPKTENLKPLKPFLDMSPLRVLGLIINIKKEVPCILLIIRIRFFYYMQCMYVSMYCLYVCMYVCMYDDDLKEHVYMYVCMYVCMYV